MRSLAALAVGALLASIGPAAAQDTARAIRPAAVPATTLQRLDTARITERSVVRHDMLRWDRIQPATRTSGLQVQGTVLVPPDSLRVARRYIREQSLRLEAPLLAIATPERTYSLELSVDPQPGLACSAFGCAGTVQLSVIDAEQPLDEVPLPTAVPVDLFGVDSVGPARLVLRSTRRLHPVHVFSRLPEATLLVRPVGYESVRVPLPVRRPEIRMSVAARTMDAWGLESVPVDIGAVQGLEPGDTIEVRLQGDGLRVEPSVVRVSAASGATAMVRSREIGRGVVRARGPSYVADAETSVDMRPPWAFFLFALAGGLAGALVAERRRGWTDTRVRLALQLVTGGLFGVILSVLTALGANLVDYPLPTGIVSEIMGFAEAGFFAFLSDSLFNARVGRGAP